MSASTWSIQDAKNQFSAVVRAANSDGAQTVTRRGKPTAVVMSIDEYERLRRDERAAAPTFAELLCAIPQRDSDDDEELFERIDVRPREVDFD